jgi:hypothetical protein
MVAPAGLPPPSWPPGRTSIPSNRGHWEAGWSEERLSFFARLIEEHTQDELAEGLLPEAAAGPVFFYGEGFGRGD